MEAEVTFKFEVRTIFGQEVYVVGNIPELGEWNPAKGLKLNPTYYPVWSSPTPLIVPKGTIFEFKIVIVENQIHFLWEYLPSNRRYMIKHEKTSLFAVFGAQEISEVRENLSRIIFEETDLMSNANLNNCRKISTGIESFDPYKIAAVSDTEDNTSSDLTELMKSSEKMIDIGNYAMGESSLEDMDSIKISKYRSVEYISSPGNKRKLKMTAKSTMQTLLPTIENVKSPFEDDFLEMMKSNKVREKYSCLSSENEITYEKVEDQIISLNTDSNFIFVTMILPLEISIRDKRSLKSSGGPSVINSWYKINYTCKNFASTLNSVLKETRFQMRDYIWVGVLVEEDLECYEEEEKKELAEFLRLEYRCIPVFVKKAEIDIAVDGFLMNHFTNHAFSSHSEKIGINFDETAFNTYTQLCRKISDTVLLEVKENSLILMVDNSIFLVANYISRADPKYPLGMIWRGSFPPLENIQRLVIGRDIISSLLVCNVICFSDFSHARNFFSVVASLLGINYQIERGLIYLLYLGRQIIIRISHPLPDSSLITSLKLSPGYKNHQQIWNDKLGEEPQLIVSFDKPESLCNLSLQIDLIREYALENPSMDIKYLAVINPNEIHNRYQQKIVSNPDLEHLISLVNNINKEIGKEVIVLQTEPLSDESRIALFAKAQVFLLAGMRHRSIFKSLEFILSKKNESGKGCVLVDQFTGHSDICNSFLEFNIFSDKDFLQKLKSIFSCDTSLLLCKLKRDHAFFAQNSAFGWLKKTLLDIQQSENWVRYARLSLVNKNALLSKVVTCSNFRHLDPFDIFERYKNKKNRLIILDIEGTLMPHDNYTYFENCTDKSITKAVSQPDPEVVRSLELLSDDPSNTLYLITGKSLETAGPWIWQIKNMGVGCEYGYIHKAKHSKSVTRLFNMDFSWKFVVRKLMEKYVSHTEGSYIEAKECSVVWKYSKVEREFGKKQSEELVSHLNEILDGNTDVEIVKTQEHVEVRPYGVNKGIIVELLLKKLHQESGKIDFVLIAGNGMADEEMFASLKIKLKTNSQYFVPKIHPILSVVGNKPSNARYFMRDNKEVAKLLSTLSTKNSL